MTLSLYDRVIETTQTGGTGPVTLLGAVPGYQPFTVVGNGNSCYFFIYEAGDTGAPSGAWEVCYGTYTAATPSISRTTVISSSNNGNPVNFTAGTTKRVVLALPASKHVYIDNNGIVILNTLLSQSGSGTNNAAHDLVISPGQSTGNAAPAKLTIQTTSVGTSGSTPQTYHDAVTITDTLFTLAPNGGASASITIDQYGLCSFIQSGVGTPFAITTINGTYPSGMMFNSSSKLTWTDDVNATTVTKSVGLCRNNPATLEVNNGTTGQYRDLVVRQVYYDTLTPIGVNNSTIILMANGVIHWTNGTQLYTAQQNGNLGLYDNAGTSFGYLQFGGTTSSYPSLHRNGAVLETKLADGSDFAYHSAKRFILGINNHNWVDNSSNGFYFLLANSVQALSVGSTSIYTESPHFLGIGFSANGGSHSDCTLAAEDAQFGIQSNTVGSNLIVRSGLSTGNAAPTTIKLQITDKGTSGTSAQTFYNALTLLSENNGQIQARCVIGPQNGGWNTTYPATLTLYHPGSTNPGGSGTFGFFTDCQIRFQVSGDRSQDGAIAFNNDGIFRFSGTISTAFGVSVNTAGTGIGAHGGNGCLTLRSDGGNEVLGATEPLAVYGDGTNGLQGIRIGPNILSNNPYFENTTVLIEPWYTTRSIMVLRAKASQTANIFEAQDSTTAVLSTISENGYWTTRKNTAPADSELSNSELAFWLDDTVGATKAMFKAKDSGGTVRTGSVALA